jgi:ELWxxDGT repeat protein
MLRSTKLLTFESLEARYAFDTAIMVADLIEGRNLFPEPTEFLPHGDGLFFTIPGQGMYFTDGTSNGTQLIFRPAPFFTENKPLWSDQDDTLVYKDERSGGHIYSLNLSTRTTTKLAENGSLITPDRASFISTRDKLFFHVDITGKGGLDYELMVTDGTVNGTKAVFADAPNNRPVDPTYLGAIGNVVYFYAREFDGVKGVELWRSDGTQEGTYIVRDITPGFLDGTTFGDAAVVGDKLYFTATPEGTNVFSNTLWVSDGTEAGTHPVLGIETGIHHHGLASHDNSLIWKQPVFAGTKVRQLSPDGQVKNLSTFVNIDVGDFVSAGEALYVTSSIGLLRRSETDPIPFFVEIFPFSPVELIAVGDTLFFVAPERGENSPSELWEIKGVLPPRRIADIHPDEDDVGERPHMLTIAGSKLYFVANDFFHGRELWVLTTSRVIGDVNNDGVFNSSDLVSVFQAGKYEDGIPFNATFEEGDWNGDGDFNTSDLVYAFQAGTFVATSLPLRPTPTPH